LFIFDDAPRNMVHPHRAHRRRKLDSSSDSKKPSKQLKLTDMFARGTEKKDESSKPAKSKSSSEKKDIESKFKPSDVLHQASKVYTIFLSHNSQACSSLGYLLCSVV
jgi:hypothetical protein